MSKRLMMAASFALATALFLGGAWAQAQLQPAAGALRQQTFDIVWRTVKEKHFDPAMGGVDWDKARET
ncbi:MAG: hypothetical protein MOB07_28590, partial [Acidobacteria bacterium]|nr:hypothetical protein [Acidobacteriota bacterium]